MASYFRARDELEPVSRDELLDRLRWGTATVLGDLREVDPAIPGIAQCLDWLLPSICC
jgi:hypothetical protein